MNFSTLAHSASKVEESVTQLSHAIDDAEWDSKEIMVHFLADSVLYAKRMGQQAHSLDLLVSSAPDG